MRLPVGDLPEADWHRCLDVNLTGVYLCAKAAIPAMQKNGGGSIINLSSIYGLVGADVRAAYVASKGGVTNLTPRHGTRLCRGQNPSQLYLSRVSSRHR